MCSQAASAADIGYLVGAATAIDDAAAAPSLHPYFPDQSGYAGGLTSPGPRSAEIVVTSRLAAPAAAVWERVITPAGINDEMRPWLRMTVPAGFEGLDPDRVVLGERIGRSWVLLFGLLPLDYDDLTLVRLEPGRGFLERSTMLSQRSWEHERTIEPDGDGVCRITDRVHWQPRLGLPGRPLRPMIGWFFRHRHGRLRRYFGGMLAPTV
jgi:ligand-binding SRPBCC domain-containing protein